MYILKSVKNSEIYIGSTKDLRKRIELHNEGKVKSTKLKIPLQLIYYEAFSDESEARHREQALKRDGRTLYQLKLRIRKSLLKK